MSLLYTEDQLSYIKMVREMAEKKIKPYVAECDRTGECPVELFKPAIDMGLHMLEIPEEYGGAGMDFETTAMIYEELAKVDAGYADTLVTNFVALRNVILAGTPEQARHFADIIEAGKFAAPCERRLSPMAMIIYSTAQRCSRPTANAHPYT